MFHISSPRPNVLSALVVTLWHDAMHMYFPLKPSKKIQTNGARVGECLKGINSKLKVLPNFCQFIVRSEPQLSPPLAECKIWTRKYCRQAEGGL